MLAVATAWKLLAEGLELRRFLHDGRRHADAAGLRIAGRIVRANVAERAQSVRGIDPLGQAVHFGDEVGDRLHLLDAASP